MQVTTIDPTRLEALRSISASEQAALESARELLHADMARGAQLRKDILSAKQPTAGKTRRREPRPLQSLTELQNEQSRINMRIEEHEQTVEIAQERARAAKLLRKRCEAFIAGRLDAESGR
ncbi:hypothetical protein ACFYE9_09645 [Rhizobium leguminosarum]|uniref:Uncharacterized protein n=2 Tax=Rhizobium leguminosarum TaxID=384 RepID=A0A154IJ31_RHILE|nr:hypothetical protein [Rhizobium leguminosarum]KZA99969.1 hypothetical protein A4A59_19530 [Rhizobium leguminosarum]